MLRKRGTLRVRPPVEESKAGRHKPLLKINHPLRQIQGHRLIAIRQAAKERVLTTTLHLAPDIVLPRVHGDWTGASDTQLDAALARFD